MTKIIPSSQSENAPPSAEVNFALVLSRLIDSLQQNPAELRATVYELARVKLYEQLGHENATETKRLVSALEEAIAGVESFSRNEDEKKAHEAALAMLGKADILLHGTIPSATDRSGLDAAESPISVGVTGRAGRHRETTPAPEDRRSGSRAPGFLTANHVARWRFLPVGLAARFVLVLLVVGSVTAVVVAWPRLRDQIANLKRSGAARTAVAVHDIDRDVNPRSGQDITMAKPPGQPLVQPVPPDQPGFPLPTTFGIYAISDGRLSELKALAGKVPDSRVAVSAAISAPSETVLPDGKVKFVVFRRDGASSAPDRVDVRVVAKVTRAMGVDGAGKAKMAPAQDSWVIRNVMIPYKVGPVEEHPEMFLIQADDADVPLPAGRYAVVVKGQGYDFTVDGTVSDPRQCMERVDAVNGVFYSPCPKPGESR